MTERQLQQLIFYKRHAACRLVLPNYTPGGWFECDVFAVTKAGYGVEFEIKVTAADFKRDAEKTSKHELLAARSERAPSRFWYVVPSGLTSPLLPEYAGLMTFNGNRIAIARDAPRLHSALVPENTLSHALSVCYWRYWRERRSNSRKSEEEKLIDDGLFSSVEDSELDGFCI